MKQSRSLGSGILTVNSCQQKNPEESSGFVKSIRLHAYLRRASRRKQGVGSEVSSRLVIVSIIGNLPSFLYVYGPLPGFCDGVFQLHLRSEHRSVIFSGHFPEVAGYRS